MEQTAATTTTYGHESAAICRAKELGATHQFDGGAYLLFGDLQPDGTLVERLRFSDVLAPYYTEDYRGTVHQAHTALVVQLTATNA